MRRGLAVLAFAFEALSQNRNCASLEAAAEAKVAAIEIAKDQLGETRELGDHALAAARACSDSPRLWYLAIRSAEIVQASAGTDLFANTGEFKNILAEAISHAPKSAPLATIAARTSGDPTLARNAFELDPHYLPALRVYAESLARAGSVPEALRMVTAAAGVRSSQLYLTRARVLLAAKKPADALIEVRKSAAPGLSSDEFAPLIDQQRDWQEVMGLVQVALHNPVEAEKSFRGAAAMGSTVARRYLEEQATKGNR